MKNEIKTHSAASLWLNLDWPSGIPLSAPRALLSLSALGDMPLKPSPPLRVFSEVEKIFPGKRFVWLNQEHTRFVLLADHEDEICGQIGDGLVADKPETLIGVSVADCMPVFLWDTANGARALCHSGWKGTGIIREALTLMKARYSSNPESIQAILGPSIRSCCYAVPEERAWQFTAEFGSDTAINRDGNWYIDLAAANKNILLSEGIKAVQVHQACTCCDMRFSSYRRQGKALTHMLALCGV